MSDPRRLEGERVFCHQCNNEWDRARGGLQCPRCEGEFVEILHGNNQPNVDDFDLNEPDSPSDFRSAFPPSPPLNTRPRPNTFSPPPHPLHNHNPWADAPDPEEGDISTFQFQTPGGGRGTFSFTSRTYTSANAPFGAHPPGTQHIFGFGSPPGFGDFHPRGGAFGQAQARGPQPGNMQDLFSAIFSTMQQAQMEGQNGRRGAGGMFVGGGNAQPSPFDLLSALLNPGANAGRAGDMVWSQQDFDRILEQLAAQGSNAPPPASEAAINALPKKKVDKEMLGEDGKAECSICMEAVELDTEVTSLPCNHWFHEDCVVAWLKEHDTCPHCRKPITTDQQRQQQPPSPGAARRPSRRSSSVASPHGTGTRDNPWSIPDSPSAVREARNRFYANRSTSDRDRGPQTPIRRSTSPARSTEPQQQYYGGRYESTDYYAGRPEAPQSPSQRRASRSESQRSPGGGGGGGVTGWIRDHLPMGGNR